MSDKPKIILITGASSGIGKTCAEYLSEQGHTIYGTSRYPGSYPKPDGYRLILLDVNDDASVKNGIEQIINECGRIDVVVNNASVHIAGSIEDTPTNKAREQLEANIFGVHRMCKAVIPYMREQQNGYIINTGSLGGVFSLPYTGFYNAAKFALEGLIEALHFEVRPFDIKVCLIEPGDVHIEPAHKRWKTPLSSESPYYASFNRVMDVIEKDEQNGSAPIKIAKLINKIIQKENPKLRYIVGGLLDKLVPYLKLIPPQRFVDWLIIKLYKVV